MRSLLPHNSRKEPQFVVAEGWRLVLF
jgi:hypothetical protein